MATPEKKEKKTKTSQHALMAQKLAQVLSDTYVLAVKLHGYHWNVMGPNFKSLHDFFAQQYEALFEAADEIAERIRILGLMPDGSMESFLQNTSIKEAGPKALPALAMLKDTLDSHRILRDRLIEAEDLADDLDDIVTQDLLTQRLAWHEKTMWMIRSHLD